MPLRLASLHHHYLSHPTRSISHPFFKRYIITMAKKGKQTTTPEMAPAAVDPSAIYGFTDDDGPGPSWGAPIPPPVVSVTLPAPVPPAPKPTPAPPTPKPMPVPPASKGSSRQPPPKPAQRPPSPKPKPSPPTPKQNVVPPPKPSVAPPAPKPNVVPPAPRPPSSAGPTPKAPDSADSAAKATRKMELKQRRREKAAARAAAAATAVVPAPVPTPPTRTIPPERALPSPARSSSPPLSMTFNSSHGGTEFSLLDASDDDTAELLHDHRTAPLILRDAFDAGVQSGQYGVLGSIVSVHSQEGSESVIDKRIYVNTNAPFSAVVCGVQGSGKSHTVGVLLESMMIADTRLGQLSQPLAGLVLHFGESGGAAQPCEAAYQAISTEPGISPPRVVVFVSPSSFETMRHVYTSVFGNTVTVLPLRFTHEEIDAKSLLSMMCVSNSSEPPLYIQIVLSILRDLGESFSFEKFKYELESRQFNPAQLAGLNQRMALLESFLTPTPCKARFAPKQITIVDLTDPFIDPASACSLFEIITRLFLREKMDTGKVLVVDEAHKYLTGKSSAALTQTLLSITRQQRHLGVRMIISTQEPTVIPEVLLDLCSVTIMHRFSSISWFDHLSKHVSSEFGEKAFDAVVKLKTGQAIILAPSGIGQFRDPGSFGPVTPTSLGRRYLIVKMRRRVTKDGGRSILVVGQATKAR